MKFHLHNFGNFPEQCEKASREDFSPQVKHSYSSSISRRTLQIWSEICRGYYRTRSFSQISNELKWWALLELVFRFPFGLSKIFFTSLLPTEMIQLYKWVEIGGGKLQLNFNSMSIQLIKWLNRGKCCSHYEHKELVWPIKSLYTG